MTWKTFALVACTFDQEKEDISSLSCGPFNLGPGADKYPEAANVIVGENAARFLARQDVTCLWHWAPPWVLRAIRSHATKPVKIGFVAAYEAVPTVGFWSLLQAPLMAVSEAFVLKGTDGKPVTNGPITWIDVAAPGYAEAYVNAIEWILETKYSMSVSFPSIYVGKIVERPDFIFYDSMIGRPWYANVPNAPPTVPAYVRAYTRGWKRLLREHQARIGPVWANTNVYDATYHELANRFLEHAYTGRSDLDRAGIAKAAARGRAVIGFEGAPPHQAYWDSLAKNLATARNDRIYLCTARTGKNFAIICPDNVVAKP